MNFFEMISFLLAFRLLTAAFLSRDFAKIRPHVLPSPNPYHTLYSSDLNSGQWPEIFSTPRSRIEINSSYKTKRQSFENGAKKFPKKSKFPFISLGTRKLRQLLTSPTIVNDFQIDRDENDYSAIPGTPGVHYPIYAEVPQTSFDCLYQEFPGYYADLEAQCQVFHICALNRTYSFLCPNGTIFSQAVLVCVWWHQYNCAISPSLYSQNAYIYDYGDKIDKTKLLQRANSKYFNQSGIEANIAFTPNAFLAKIPLRTPLSTQIPSIHKIPGRVVPSILRPALVGTFDSTSPTTASTSSTDLKNFLSFGLREPKLSFAPIMPISATVGSHIPPTNLIDRFRVSKIFKPVVGGQFDIQNVEPKGKIPDDGLDIISNIDLTNIEISTTATVDRRYLPPPTPPVPLSVTPSVYQIKRRVKRF